MKFQRLHPDGSLSKAGLAYWRGQTTENIVKSLMPGQREGLRAKANGIIMNGNTRMKVLEERGVSVESLPYELYR